MTRLLAAFFSTPTLDKSPRVMHNVRVEDMTRRRK
jgi:hypothetical protein